MLGKPLVYPSTEVPEAWITSAVNCLDTAGRVRVPFPAKSPVF